MAENTRYSLHPETGRTASKRRISPIWIIPIVALAIAGYLGYVAISEKGPEITLSFVTAEGLEAGKTKIKYKDVDIGLITDVQVSQDLTGVIATAEMEKDVAPFLTENTEFWIVKPRIGVGGVSGIGTLLSGAHIAMLYNGEGEARREFVGLEVPPAISSDVPGTLFSLKSNELGQISQGTPIYFSGIEVGLVLDYSYDLENQLFTMPIFVRAPFDDLVDVDSSFWRVGGFGIKTSATGVSLDTPPLEALLRGGIAFSRGGSNTTNAEPGREFELFANKESTSEALLTRRIPLLVEFGGTVRGLKVGAPVEWRGLRVGSVSDIWIVDDPDRAVSVGAIIDIEPERTNLGDESRTDDEIYQNISAYVERGMRAQLKTANILTGELFVEFVFQADLEVMELDMSTTPPTAPSMPSELDYLRNSLTEMIAKIQSVPIESIAQRLDNTLAAIESVATSPEVQTGVQNFANASGDLAVLLADLNANSEPILSNLTRASADLTRALDAAENTMASADSMLAEDSPLRIELENATSELARAARSVRIFADTLERDPSAIVRGKR